MCSMRPELEQCRLVLCPRKLRRLTNKTPPNLKDARTKKQLSAMLVKSSTEGCISCKRAGQSKCCGCKNQPHGTPGARQHMATVNAAGSKPATHAAAYWHNS